MIKRGVIITIIMLATGLLLVSAYSQEDMTVVDNSVFLHPERTPAIFNHDEHNELAGIDDCSECHHVYEDGVKLEDESSEDMLCSDCHTLDASDEQPALMKAFHLNCKGCHISEDKGPVMCGECHKK